MDLNELAELQPRNAFEEEAETEQQEINEPEDSPTENNDEEESPSHQGDQDEASEQEESDDAEQDSDETESNTDDANESLPWHKDPRWKRMQEQAKRAEELEERLKSLEEKTSQQNPQTEGDQVPQEYREAFGDNVEAYKKYAYLEEISRKKALEELQAKQKEADSASQKQLELVQQKIEEVEDQFNVSLSPKSALRKEFVQFLVDHKIGGQQGEYDFVTGWKLFDSIRKNSSKNAKEAKRKVAAQASTHSATSTEEEPEVYTLDQMKTW
jgi:DNA repair exonuclease SbcCD ATPase subunit